MKMNLFRNLFSSKGLALSKPKGFTLIELLIVIAILGVLAAGILIAIDPVDKINAGNDAKVQNDISGVGRATEAFATTHSGFYPALLADLVTGGELKRSPTAPTGYTAYTFNATPGGCVGGTSCTGVVMTGLLKSKRFTAPGTPVWRYESSTGKSCAVATTTTACP